MLLCCAGAMMRFRSTFGYHNKDIRGSGLRFFRLPQVVSNFEGSTPPVYSSFHGGVFPMPQFVLTQNIQAQYRDRRQISSYFSWTMAILKSDNQNRRRRKSTGNIATTTTQHIANRKWRRAPTFTNGGRSQVVTSVRRPCIGGDRHKAAFC